MVRARADGILASQRSSAARRKLAGNSVSGNAVKSRERPAERYAKSNSAFSKR
jgi:hypothetical protein